MPNPTRCTYVEGRRRCPFQGEGTPCLCPAHRIALAEAGKPRSPIQIIGDAVNNFLSGKPINVDATIGAAGAVWESLGQGGMGQGYHPNIDHGSEDQAHRREQAGNQRPPSWWEARSRPQPPPDDPQIVERLRARKILGFEPRARLTEDMIREAKKRLARKYHPDRPGGSTQKMAAVNNAADVLMAAL